MPKIETDAERVTILEKGMVGVVQELTEMRGQRDRLGNALRDLAHAVRTGGPTASSLRNAKRELAELDADIYDRLS